MGMTDEGSFDYKIIAIPYGDPTFNSYRNIEDIPHHITDEIKHFFNVYKTLEHKNTTVLEVMGRERALEIITDSIRMFREKFGVNL